jgi:hypothetical protein
MPALRGVVRDLAKSILREMIIRQVKSMTILDMTEVANNPPAEWSDDAKKAYEVLDRALTSRGKWW